MEQRVLSLAGEIICTIHRRILVGEFAYGVEIVNGLASYRSHWNQCYIVVPPRYYNLLVPDGRTLAISGKFRYSESERRLVIYRVESVERPDVLVLIGGDPITDGTPSQLGNKMQDSPCIE
jgi:hypothetical protein